MVLAVDVPGYNVELSKTDGLKVTQKETPPTPTWLKILKAVAIVLLLIVCIIVLIVGTRMNKKKRSATAAPEESSYRRR